MELHIETNNYARRFDLESRFAEVKPYFRFSSETRILCFLDDENDAEFVALMGATNRGFHISLIEYYARPALDRIVLPRNVNKRVSLGTQGPNFDNLVYVQGSTTRNPIALVMTVAHELQHAWQEVNHYDLLQTNMKMMFERRGFKGEYINNPSEREAMFVSRRIAVEIFGRDRVRQYLEEQLEGARQELVRWNYLNNWDALFLDFKTETEIALEEHRSSFPDSKL